MTSTIVQRHHAPTITLDALAAPSNLTPDAAKVLLRSKTLTDQDRENLRAYVLDGVREVKATAKGDAMALQVKEYLQQREQDVKAWRVTLALAIVRSVEVGIFPSQDAIAREAGVSPSTVSRLGTVGRFLAAGASQSDALALYASAGKGWEGLDVGRRSLALTKGQGKEEAKRLLAAITKGKEEAKEEAKEAEPVPTTAKEEAKPVTAQDVIKATREFRRYLDANVSTLDVKGCDAVTGLLAEAVRTLAARRAEAKATE